MYNKPLDQTEMDLLEIIRRLHAEKGPFLRSTLSVIGRGRGLDVARSFNRLKSLGLVEEVEQRPFFLMRLFGAKPTVLLQPSATDRSSTNAAPFDVPPPPLDVQAPVAIPATQPKPKDPTPVAEATSEQLQPTAALSIPPKTVRTRPIRIAPDAYTDDIGGQPLAYAPVPLVAGLDTELLEGLREMLDVMGMEMTRAGEAMISDRMAKGASAGEALCQVALFAFAHAAKYDILAGDGTQPNLLHDYAVEVIQELEKLRDAGEVRAEPFEHDMRAIWSLTDKTTDRNKLVSDLLSDPIGGAAPPAVLPEEVRGVEDYDDKDPL